MAQAYEYFKVRIGLSLLIEAEEIDVTTLTRHCDYDRTKDLVTTFTIVAFAYLPLSIFQCILTIKSLLCCRYYSASGAKTDVTATKFLSLSCRHSFPTVLPANKNPSPLPSFSQIIHFLSQTPTLSHIQCPGHKLPFDSHQRNAAATWSHMRSKSNCRN